MSPLTALDLSKIRFSLRNEWTSNHDCPWCGSDAWSGSSHMQCLNQSCPVQAADPLDVVVKVLGLSYEDADAKSSIAFGREPSTGRARCRQDQRAVMDFWIRQCNRPRTTSEIQVITNLDKQGLNVKSCRFSATIIGRDGMKELRALAADTGADYPESWDTEVPPPSLVFCVQSVPHTIDRMVIYRGRSAVSVTWRPMRIGFTGLIGMRPDVPRFLAQDQVAAMRLQLALHTEGV